MGTGKRSTTAHGYRDRLYHLLREAEGLDTELIELQAHLARYVCVLTSGYIEEVVRSAVLDHCDGKNQPEALAFIGREVGRFQNPKVSKIVELLQSFDPRWADNFESALRDEERDAINSVVGLRHSIAHGRSVSLSLVPMRRYLDDVCRAVDRLDSAME